MNNQRRQLLKGAWAASAVGVAVAAGLLKPGAVYAAPVSKAAFDAKNIADALKGVGAAGAAESKDIVFTEKTPNLAESGDSVDVEVISNIPGTESIALFVEKNVNPLVAHFDLMNGAQGYINVRIKMRETSKVRAVVKAGGKYYTAAKEVKLTLGGCGG